MKFPPCVVCGRPCIPLADYEQATCIACDDTMRLVLARAGMLDPPTRPADVWRGLRAVKPCGTHAAFTRHKRRGEPIDAACVAAEKKYRSELWAATAAQRRNTGECTVRIEDSA